jgi:hypothetical protein
MYEPTLLQGRSFNRVGEKAERVLYLQSFRIDPRTNQCWPTQFRDRRKGERCLDFQKQLSNPS